MLQGLTEAGHGALVVRKLGAMTYQIAFFFVFI